MAYDIRDDRTRGTVSELLTYYGLHRIQYSVFGGVLGDKDLRELLCTLEELQLNPGDKIYLFPMCSSCLKKHRIIGKEISVPDSSYRIL